jgi:hypothetical protein
MLDGLADNVDVGAGGGGGGAAPTLTATDFVVLPPLLEHVSVNVDAAVSGPVLNVPDVGFVPDQAPDATQLCARLTDQ